MLHDIYDLDIEYIARAMPFLGRDNDESGQEGFWDLAAKVTDELQYHKAEEKQEILYNAFHKIREESMKYVLRYASTLPNYTETEMEPIRDLIALLAEAEQIKV